MSDHQHQTPIKNWKQLVIVVVAAFAIPIALFILVSQIVSGGRKGAQDDDSGIIERIKPIGDVKFAVASGPKGALTGEQVYGQVCKTCHEAGLAGAHKLGDKAAWGKVITQGEKLTFEHANKGIRGMPAKGGRTDLEDVEVQRAVVFMINKSGGSWKEPPGPTAIAAANAPMEGRTGEQVVAAACGKCHQTGQGGAPRIGDRDAWVKRVAAGLDPVYKSALKGHSGMPARGGMASLSDTEIKRAVEFMLNAGAVAPGAAAPAAAAATAPVATAAVDGKKTYDTICMACHATGAAGAPKLGDKAAWAPRLKTGAEALYASVLKGKGAMPAKGGNPALSDAEIKASVDYMTAASR